MRFPTGSGKTPVILLFSLMLVVMSPGCNDDDFCCLHYDFQTPEQDYCYAHSRIAGHFLLDAMDDSEAGLQIALSQLRQLIADMTTCDSIDCIEYFIKSNPDLAGLWSRYRDEHDAIESRFVRDGYILSDTEKCRYICCGFIDAYQRTMRNIENNGVTM